jgi:transcriptional regulator with XRE-family HTH domain
MNESLHRALLRAHLSEEDMAARLQVDPKTVRRWLEGRVPYPRHRWLIASALGVDEAELWPHLDTSRSLPQALRAIYPHREDIPRETWLRLFADARDRIDILVGNALFVVGDPEVLAILADRAEAGVRERICLSNPNAPNLGPGATSDALPGEIRDDAVQLDLLRSYADVEIRTHRIKLTNSMYRSDDDCLVAPIVYGISASRTPIIRVHLSTENDDSFEAYLESFEHIWVKAQPSGA